MWNESEWINALNGKTIEGIDVSDEERALRFRCADGSVVVWGTSGDCCSESWWADGFQLNALRGATVRGASAIEMPEPKDDRTRQEVDEAHGVKVQTDRGVADLVFRNSSNGYYGGWAHLDGDEGYEWREITGNDWRA
jgi:hypothetical protein